MRLIARGFGEAAETALVHPRSAAGLGVLGVISAALAAVVDSTAAAIAAAALLAALVAGFIYALVMRSRFDGPCRVVGVKALWDLAEPDGVSGRSTRSQDVIWNHKSWVATERAWGTAPGVNPFDDYEAEHGRLVDVQPEEDEWLAIVALHDLQQRGDRQTLVAHRECPDRWPDQQREWCVLEVTQAARDITMEVRFPTRRPPRDAKLVHTSGDRKRSEPLEATTEVGRKVLKARIRGGKLKDKYTIQWDWDPYVAPGPSGKGT